MFSLTQTNPDCHSTCFFGLLSHLPPLFPYVLCGSASPVARALGELTQVVYQLWPQFPYENKTEKSQTRWFLRLFPNFWFKSCDFRLFWPSLPATETSYLCNPSIIWWILNGTKPSSGRGACKVGIAMTPALKTHHPTGDQAGPNGRWSMFLDTVPPWCLWNQVILI
jgi:hypothetical protein